MSIPRHETTVPSPADSSKVYWQYATEDAHDAVHASANLVSAADYALKSARFGLLASPKGNEQAFRSLLLYAQAGAALLGAAKNEGSRLLHIINEPIEISFMGPTNVHDPHRWLDTLWCAVICRESELVDEICDVPISALRNTDVEYDDYIYQWVDAVISFMRVHDDVYPKILNSMRATTEEIQHSSTEAALMRYSPQMQVLFHVAERDSGKFNESLLEALQLHKQFWSQDEDRANTPEGYISLPLTAMAVLASQFGMTVDVTSDYLPEQLVNGTLGEQS